ncbi:ABC transporter ATP-binding protein [Christensenellaceae bacterium OttesenSCG-928-K19]|nr:ABC transporter ATP-binding protein [Christensenellaceae bacterium OttesenSCG-928-K19]
MGIEVKNISFRIDDTQILRDVSLKGESGMLGLIGPNGAGKTTLLRVISGYIKPDEGQVLLDNMPISQIDIKTRAQKMALVPQNYALDYDFTVLEVVLMGRNPHKKSFESDTPEDIALARDCINRAGIGQLESRSIMGLSGGEWQRMIIARALTQQSSILLLDEPVSNLDIKHQVGILNTVRELVTGHGLLCVCVLHDLNLAYHYCDSIALMKQGGMFATGAPRAVVTKDTLESVYETEINLLHTGEDTFILPVMKG